MWTIDTETAVISRGCLAPPLTCLQYAFGKDYPNILVQDVDDIEGLLDEMFDSGETIVGHNIPYDLLVIATEYPRFYPRIIDHYDRGLIRDTLIREKLAAITKGRLKITKFDLGSLAEKHGSHKDKDDPWRLRYGELRGVPLTRWPLEAISYALQDVIATRDVYLAQDEYPDEIPQTRYAFLMHCISARGVHTDLQAVDLFERQIVDQRNKDKDLLHTYDLVRADGTRNLKAARERIVKAYQGRDFPRTPKGAPQLDEDACLQSGDDLLITYHRYGAASSFLTRIQSLKSGFIQPRFDSLKETGRTSCSKGKFGYQIQNMSRQIGERECFVPEKGNLFLACDFDSFELCALGQVCIDLIGESTLAEAINDGLDPHLQTVCSALGEEYLEILAIYKDTEHPRHKEVKELRQGMKIANFGYPGGMGSSAFVSYARGFGLNLTPEESADLRDRWFIALPEMVEYFRHIGGKHQWSGNNRTQIQQLRSGRFRGHCTYTQACNSYFQGLAADAAKAAGWRLLKEHPWHIWNFVHDEFLLEGPESEGHEAAMLAKEIMEEEAQKWMPDVKIRTSPVLMRRWTKNAEQVWVDGRLQP